MDKMYIDNTVSTNNDTLPIVVGYQECNITPYRYSEFTTMEEAQRFVEEKQRAHYDEVTILDAEKTEQYLLKKAAYLAAYNEAFVAWEKKDEEERSRRGAALICTIALGILGVTTVFFLVFLIKLVLKIS